MYAVKKMLRVVAALVTGISILAVSGLDVYADTAGSVLKSESVGASIVFNTNAYNQASTEALGITLEEEVVEDTSDLMMANVKSVLNVRKSADTEAEIVGKLYKDCGGRVLERGEEWSLIESGELVGWASNEYLLFDQEAEELAREVGFMNVTITKDAVYVRSEENINSKAYGVLALNATAELIDESDELWYKIAYGDYDGYIFKNSAKVTFEVDAGETMEAIKARKKAEEEARLALIRKREAMKTDENTERLMAAIIQCEAGGEPYEGMLAVGAVVMNRVRSAAYPSTVYDVLYASGQFSPAKSGSLERVYDKGPKAICYQAAREALAGYTNVGDMTHFRRKGTKEGFIIGNHVFY